MATTLHTGSPRRRDTAAAKAAARGFTLIELLVVISIIALLISILLPALGKAKQSAEDSACLANIHSLLQATHTYLAEYNGTFPYNGMLFPHPIASPPSGLPSAYVDYCNNPANYRVENGGLWTELGGSVSNQSTSGGIVGSTGGAQRRSIYMCPSDTGQRTNRNALTEDASTNPETIYADGSHQGYWSYSVNTVINQFGLSPVHDPSQFRSWGDPLKFTQVKSPTEFLVFIEEDAGSNFNDEVFDPPALNGGDKLTTRHNNGGNLGFADGHAEWIQEVLFDNVPTSGKIMLSPYTRWFLPDGGDFAKTMGN